jgi:transposase
MVLAQGLTMNEASKRIAIPLGTLATWVKAVKLGNGAVTAPGSSVSGGEEAAQGAGGSQNGARYSKKAATYFARESLPSTRS